MAPDLMATMVEEYVSSLPAPGTTDDSTVGAASVLNTDGTSSFAAVVSSVTRTGDPKLLPMRSAILEGGQWSDLAQQVGSLPEIFCFSPQSVTNNL